MLGGKQTFHGRAGHYVAVMRAAVLRHSLGESYAERVSDAAGVIVSNATRARHVQGDERLSEMKVSHKIVTTKTTATGVEDAQEEARVGGTW